MRAVWLALVLALGGCDFEPSKSSASLTYTEDAHKAYLEAMDSFENKDWEDARQLFSEVKRLFAYSKYARLAELRIADVDFEQGKFSDAIAGYRGFIKGHRADENVEYAKYRICKSLYLDISDTLFLPPAEERDQANTRDAFNELKAFTRRFPRSRYRVDAEYMLEMVTQRLARHELYVAHYYLKKDNFQAVVARIDYALDHYPGSGLDAEALVLKGETQLKMHKTEDAKRTFVTVVRDYGGPFGKVAQRFLDMMKEKGGKPSAARTKEEEPPPEPKPESTGDEG